MRNKEAWQPSKYVYTKGRLKGSRDPKALGIGSRLSADLVAEQYERHLGSNAKGMLLDLGCGAVPLFHAYSDFVDGIVCADWSKSLHPSPHLDVICDLSVALPFADECFDTIILSSVLEHVPNPGLLWAEVARIMRPGGKIILNSPFYYGIHEAPHDYYRFTEFALRRLATASRMEMLMLEATGGAPEVLTDIFAKVAARLPVAGRYLAIFSQWLAGHVIGNRWGRQLSLRTRSQFPLSYFAVAMKPRRPVGRVECDSNDKDGDSRT